MTNIMDRCNVIVVGASASGVSSLMQLVSGLPEVLDAAVAAALAIPEEARSALSAILSRKGPLQAIRRRSRRSRPLRAGSSR